MINLKKFKINGGCKSVDQQKIFQVSDEKKNLDSKKEIKKFFWEAFGLKVEVETTDQHCVDGKQRYYLTVYKKDIRLGEILLRKGFSRKELIKKGVIKSIEQEKLISDIPESVGKSGLFNKNL